MEHFAVSQKAIVDLLRSVKMLLVKTGLLFEPCDMFCLMDLLNLFALTLGGTAMYFVDSITVECG